MSRAREIAGMSLQYKLPLLITGLLVSVVSVGMLFAYLQVQQAAIDTARARLALVTSELVSIVQPGIRSQLDTLSAVAAEPVVRNAVAGPGTDRDELRAALERARVAADPDAPIVVLDAERSAVDALAGGSPAASPLPVDHLPDAGYSPFFEWDGGVRYWVVAPVGDGSAPAGYVAQFRTVSGDGAANPIESLLGGETELLLGTDSAPGLWVTLGGEQVTPPDGWPFEGATQYDAADGPYFVHSARLGGTPWQIIARAPADVVLARSTAFARQAGLALLVLAIVGAAGAWALSWRITRPIRALRYASDSLGRGDYAERIEVDRTDELGALAEAYNRMADRIQTAHLELRQQYETARALAAELDRAGRAKSEFLATMSHEIRTPINAIIGYTDLLLLGVEGPVNPSQVGHLERIRVSGRHLVTLVDQVLDLARIESGKLEMVSTQGELVDSIRTMFTVLGPQAESKGIQLSDGTGECGGLRYAGDPPRVDQILINLLSNAIKFTEPGGRVDVRCETRTDPLPVDGREGPWTCVAISDTGMGIPEEQLERIFGAFIQVESGYTRRHGGAGLGLAISLRLARSMGGDISVESRIGRGSTFVLWLPVHAPVTVSSPGMGVIA